MTTFVTRPYDPTAANVLTTAGYLPPVARALSARGIRSPEDLNEAWSGMLPPNLLTGIDRAAERLLAARNRGEHVTIVADYDCDGATACAVGIRGLSALGLSVDYFVPDRVRHGYGLTAAIVDLLAARPNPPQVILTVDNGISSADAVRHAATLGIDVVITDHHLPADDTPPAVAIVNPNQRGCGFPSKSLAGVGVIFYVLLALRARLRDEGAFTAQTQPRLNELVDLVALGHVNINTADCVHERLHAIEVNLGVFRNLHAAEVVHRLDHVIGAAIAKHRVDLNGRTLVDIASVARDRDERNLLLGWVNARENDGVGAVGLLTRTAVGAQKEHVERLTRYIGVDKRRQEVARDDLAVVQTRHEARDPRARGNNAHQKHAQNTHKDAAAHHASAAALARTLGVAADVLAAIDTARGA